MIHRIIQKEKRRQNKWKRIRGCVSHEKEHKKSLINFKEYLEEEVLPEYQFNSDSATTGNIIKTGLRVSQLKEDIEELTKMIEAYS